MKELKTKIGREVRTDWLGTLKSLFISSDIENSNNEYDNWAKANENILTEEEVNVAKLEKLLQHPDRNVKRREQRTKNRKASANTDRAVTEMNMSMQEKAKEIEHEDR